MKIELGWLQKWSTTGKKDKKLFLIYTLRWL